MGRAALRFAQMRRAWASRLNRILIAGDGTLLVADNALTEPLPVAEVLAEEHPLRQAAAAMLSGGRGLPPDVRVRQVRNRRGQLAAVELQRGPVGLPLLALSDWSDPSDVAPKALTDDPTGLGLPLLLPDVPTFRSGLRELSGTGRMLRDLRVVERNAPSDTVHRVRLYAWRPDPAPGTEPIGVTVDVTGLTGPSEDTGPFLDALLSVGPDAVLVLDLQREELLWSNRRLAGLLGYPADGLSRFADLRAAAHWSDRDKLTGLIATARAEGETAVRELQLRLRDAYGRWRWMRVWLTPWLAATENGVPVVEQLVLTIRDVDEAVRAEHRLHWEARHDPLTGLANRRALHELLEQIADDLNDPRRYVYFLDLDDFRRVNDALGHSAGDELLRSLAARLSVLVHPSDLVARFGGDELVVVSRIEPALLADRMLGSIRARTMVAGSEISVSCSLGVAVLGSAELPGDVIRRANNAMYRAKRSGRNTFRLAGPLDPARAQQRVELEADLRRAVAEESPELYLAFQPIVDRNLTPAAAESLLRWDHPTRGVLLPEAFLDVADGAALIGDLGALILRRAVAHAAEWASAGHPLLVTVNLAAHQLGSGAVEQTVLGLLSQTGTAPQRLCLEVTEAVLVDGDSPELAELRRLREHGVKIALDDFGTGYSPLTYLKRMPASSLKLDKSFVAGVESGEPADLAVAKSVLQLATDLGLRVVAEGVETPDQFETLAALGYEFFQGFWAYPPMPAAQLGALLARPRAVAGRQDRPMQ